MNFPAEGGSDGMEGSRWAKAVGSTLEERKFSLHRIRQSSNKMRGETNREEKGQR